MEQLSHEAMTVFVSVCRVMSQEVKPCENSNIHEGYITLMGVKSEMTRKKKKKTQLHGESELIWSVKNIQWEKISHVGFNPSESPCLVLTLGSRGPC